MLRSLRNEVQSTCHLKCVGVCTELCNCLKVEADTLRVRVKHEPGKKELSKTFLRFMFYKSIYLIHYSEKYREFDGSRRNEDNHIRICKYYSNSIYQTYLLIDQIYLLILIEDADDIK